MTATATPRLSTEERWALVHRLAGEGMGTRAIARAVGVSGHTVRSDLKRDRPARAAAPLPARPRGGRAPRALRHLPPTAQAARAALLAAMGDHPTPCADGAAWTDDDPETQAVAAAACAGCPVLAACRAYGLAHPRELGVYGGLTHEQRQVLS